MKLSELQVKMVINIKDGKHLGVIADASVSTDGQISYFTVMPKHFFRMFFASEPEVDVAIDKIVKIGEDVILVDL